jgi:hypothetical protein
MGRRKIDGSVAVVFVVGETAIDDVSAPPLAAITDTDNVLDLHHEMTADGFTPNLAEDTKDVSRFDSVFNANEPGRSGGTIDLTYFRDSIAANEHAFTRMRRDQRGFLVMRFGMDKDIPFADGQEVEVYPVMCGNQRPGPMPKNSDQTKVQTLYISDAWDDRAVVGGASS